MAAPPRLLDCGTADAVRHIARERFAEAGAALERLRRRADPEALHDFRVAGRRLRSLLRAYRRWLGRAGTAKVRRRLRALGDATNAGRDAEVQLEWLERQRPYLARGERTGLNWLRRRLRETRHAGYASARKEVRASFARSRDMLERRLVELEAGPPPFRETFALLLRQHAADLEARLTAIRGPGDEKGAHAARISGKRLRYLLEPLRGEAENVTTLVGHLRDLQDLLGTLHDIHVLEATLAGGLDEVATAKARQLRDLALEGDAAAVQRERRRDERVGLVALAARARAERDARFRELEARWLRDRGRPFFLEAVEVAAATGRRPDLPLERERKFLLARLPDAIETAEVLEIEQGWLPGERLRERLRRTRDASGERYHRTIKLGAGVERIELEEETSPELFAALWPHTEGCRIAKRRHVIPAGSLTWAIDEFLGRDLVLAEVELPGPETDVPIPAWLSPVLVRDVTGDPAYLNLTLASGGGRPRGGRATRSARPRSRAPEAARPS